MSKPLLPLCSIPKQATRDGQAGENAHLYIPFYGYWFANGDVLDSPNSTIAQYRGVTLNGQAKPNTFQKDCCSCIG